MSHATLHHWWPGPSFTGYFYLRALTPHFWNRPLVLRRQHLGPDCAQVPHISINTSQLNGIFSHPPTPNPPLLGKNQQLCDLARKVAAPTPPDFLGLVASGEQQPPIATKKKKKGSATAFRFQCGSSLIRSCSWCLYHVSQWHDRKYNVKSVRSNRTKTWSFLGFRVFSVQIVHSAEGWSVVYQCLLAHLHIFTHVGREMHKHLYMFPLSRMFCQGFSACWHEALETAGHQQLPAILGRVAAWGFNLFCQSESIT